MIVTTKPKRRKDADRLAADFYATPPAIVASLRPFLLELGRTLDPCAGDGVFQYVLSNRASCWRNIDIRPEAQAPFCHISDFLQEPVLPGQYETIISNPPFSLIGEFIERALLWQPQRLIFLARLAILEGRHRYERLWRDGAHTPRQIIVLPQRPCFDGSGDVDQWAYAWFLWGDVPGRGIAWTPLLEKKSR